MKFRKDTVIYLSTILVAILILVGANQYISIDYSFVLGRTDYGAQKAEVVNIVERTTTGTRISGVSSDDLLIVFEAELLSGLAKGEVVTAAQTKSVYDFVDVEDVTVGDKIILFENMDMDSEIDWQFAEYVRIDTVWALAVVLGLCLLLFGGKQGFNTILSLLFTCGAIFMVFIPAILAGRNIYYWSIATCIYIILMTLLIINGANKKSLSAALGCTGGVLLAGALTLFMSDALRLTGLVDEESMYLVYLNPENPIDLKAIIFAAIIIGAVGAIMDVSMSLASSLQEVSMASENPSAGMLIRSGFVIGRDIMGTMANTLVLAYIGSSLSVTLLMIAYSSSTLLLFSKEMIVVEVLQAVVGSFGILFSIPMTTIICSLLYSKHKKEEQQPQV